ncbi:hypothetical protein MUG78_13210 [Gordonia alkaliphila]|uniref:hypothetical protein n=1 Tax=Gordonia alkaliphila TaxID=1053547 RepID=UPI001FF5ED87|nr:hypothetical protein [Gordonia alkaliphila]MCK0440384.1 hypothetical protein [Gordonia alkaliphila]
MTARPPGPEPAVVSRRTVLRGGAGLTLAIAAGAAVTACSPGPSDRQRDAEALVPLAQAADRQRRQAEQLAPRETEYTAALGQVAAERGAHAQALTDEINRLHAPAASGITAPAGVGAGTLDDLRAQLQKSATAASAAAAAADGFRAGLLASISASCTALKEVQLP